MNPQNFAVEVSEPETGFANAVLQELIAQLQVFAETGRHHVIDLTSLPINSTDKRKLETTLGQGEVHITLSTIGESHINETAFSGIWWVKHYNTEQKIISEFIEITDVPDIIKSHPEDIKKAANKITTITI